MYRTIKTTDHKTAATSYGMVVYQLSENGIKLLLASDGSIDITAVDLYWIISNLDCLFCRTS